MATSALNVFGLDWDRAADLATKQGYVQTLLGQGITPDQLKAKIGELDPANANQTAYESLGIPSASAPATQTTGALQTAAGTANAANTAPTGALSADDQLRADMANLSALVNSGQLASLLYPDRTFITRDMLANQPASGLQATGALQGGLSPTNTTSTSTLASDAYQKQLDADALVRGQQRYVLEAEKILGRKLTPEEATSLGQAAYPEIQRYTDPKTGVQSYMTPSYDVGSYFRDKLTDEEKQRLDRLIDSSVINAAQQKFPNLPLSIEEQERLKGLYGYEDALTYGGVGMPLDSQGNPKFLSALSESDLYNEIISGVTARQAAENQAAADRAVYDAARREGRAYNGTIYDTKEAAQKAFLDDATVQGRVYNGTIYATKEDADFWKSIDDEFARIKEQERLAALARQEAAEAERVKQQQIIQAGREGRLFQNTIYDTPEQASAARADYNRNYVLNDQTQNLSKFLGRELTEQEKANVAEIVDYYAKDYQEDKSDRYRYYFSRWNPDTKTWEKILDSSKSVWEQMQDEYERDQIARYAVPTEDLQRTFISLFGTQEDRRKFDEFQDKSAVEKVQSDLLNDYWRKDLKIKLNQQDIERINALDTDDQRVLWSVADDITFEHLARRNASNPNGWNELADEPPNFITPHYHFGNLTNYDPSKDGSIIDYLRSQNQGINRTQQASNTFIKVYKNVDGKLVDFDPTKVTQQDLKSGNTYFVIGGEREPGHPWQREWQLYNAKGDFLKPVEGEYGQVYQRYGEEPSKGKPWWQQAIETVALAGVTYGLGSGLGALTGLGGSAAGTAAATDLGGLAALGEGAGAAAASAGGVGSTLTSTLTSALPTELVQAGKTLANTFNTVRPYIQGANAVYQASQGNLAGAISSGLGAAGGFGVPGAAEAAKVFNLAYGATQGNYLPVVQELLNQSGIGGTLANTKIAGDFTLGDAYKGASFLQALQSENPTVILNAAATLTESQDLKVAAAANNFVNILNNPRATAFDIAMGADRIAGALNTASQQPPKGALPTNGQSTVTGALGTDTVSGSGAIDEYNVTGGGGALISSGNPTEDEQIAIQQRQNAANQALTDYMGSGNDLSREGLVSQLQSLGLTADQAEGYAQQADQKINMNRVGADVMARYSKIDPEFGTPQLERNTAVQELVAAGYSSERANEILDGVDRDVAAARAAALDTKASNQAAINAGAGEFAGADQRAATAAGAGEFAGADTARAVNEKISAAKTFGEAYSEARKAFGAGATFNWQGKLYSTDTFQENPALGLVPVAGSGRGQAAGKTAEQEAALLATAEQLKKIDPVARASLLDSASIDYGAVSPEGNAQGLSQTAADKLVQSAIPVNAIKTAFGMTTEAAGNALKAFGTVGESLGFNTAQMSDYGRKLENIAQELYPQALKSSEDEVKGRFSNAKTPKELGQAIVDSVLNNPGALLKMGGVELIQEAPNIALALATGGTSALIRYGGMLAGLGLDVVESAGLQGAQKIDEGLAKGLTRAQAVKGAVDDMKAAGAVTAIMTAAADKVPFGGTIAKTMIKGSAGEGTEEYLIARATGQDHMSALRQAAFGALIGGPTEATLQGAGNLTNVTINGDTMIGTYEDGTKVSISEPAGATDLKIDIIKPTDTSVNVSNTLTADLSSGADLTTSINNVVSNNITADLSGTIDSTVKAVIDNNVDLSQGVTDLTSSAVANTGDTTAVINNVVSSLASNGTDLNANAGSIVTGAVSGGASVTDAVDTTLKAVTANGGNVADAAASIITSVSASGDTAQVANATTAVVNAAITSGSNVTATTSNAVDAALAASGGSTDAVTQVVGGVASQGNNDATAAAVSSAVTTTGDTSAAVNAALANGGDASTVLSTASNAAITAGTDANTAVTNTLTSALNNNVDTTAAVDSTVKGALDAGADVSQVVNSTITAAVTNNVDTTTAITNTVTAALNNNADVSAVVDSAITTAVTNNIDTSSAITNTVTAALNNNADVSAVVDSVIKTSLDNGIDTASAVTSVITAALNNNADVSQVVSTVISTAVNNNADTGAVVDTTVKAALDNGADASVVVDSAVTSAITNGTNASQVVGSAIDAAVSSGADANTAGSAAVTAAITASESSGSDVASTLTAATAAAVNSGASTDVITDAVSNATGGSSSVTITSSNNTVTSSTVTGTVTTETTIDGKTGNSQTIIADGTTVTQTVTQGSVTTQTQVDTNTNTATVTETNAQTGQTTTTTIDLDSKVVVDVKETVTGGGGEDTLSGGVTQDAVTSKPVASTGVQIGVPVEFTANRPPEPKPQTPQSRVSLPDTGAAMLAARAVGQRSPEDWLGGKLLGSKERDKFYDPLAEFKALQDDQPQPPQSPLAETAQTSAERGMPVKPYYSYGEEPSIDDILGLSGENSSSYNEEDAVPVFKSGGKVSPLNIQMMYAKGGHTREDFRDGKHVAGPGDGQSDDIPAWLADGEFVFPADVVSALGNGSTKAGTEKLYDMMHEIRRRARSKHPKDLPPPALKSPLDYVKKGR